MEPPSSAPPGSDDLLARVLTLPQSDRQPLTVRAKALVFDDPASRALLEEISRVAPSEATVLITGETGTGKEIVARHVHALSARRAGPFVAVNCGSFPDSLVEAELFGHERGAFTGATGTKAGWFEAAQGGTLFLDEVGDLPPRVQVSLLRGLQEREVVRIGSRASIPIDVRLVAATNVDLVEAVGAGRFREDLYYRLAVAPLRLRPLRERPGDIVALARHFLAAYQQRFGGQAVVLEQAAVDRLLTHPWPGNIRELENAIHHALLVCRDGQVTAADLRLAGPVSGRPVRSAYRFCHRNQRGTSLHHQQPRPGPLPELESACRHLSVLVDRGPRRLRDEQPEAVATSRDPGGGGAVRRSGGGDCRGQGERPGVGT